jgi:uncharacterized protein YjiS (DUF1127 family)
MQTRDTCEFMIGNGMINSSLSRALGRSAFSGSSLFRQLWRRLHLWSSLSRHRAALARLDNHLLVDIGLSPEMAEAEASRPFWDVPPHWRG